jgi:UDP-N-acetylmuramate--alanine ligase
MVYVAPVYPAGEQPIEAIDASALVNGLKARGHRSAQTIAGPAELAGELAFVVGAGDIIVCLGAGDITKWAAGLAAHVADAREQAA